VAYAGMRLSKVAKHMHRIWVTTLLESANFLLGENTNEEESGFLATLPYCLNGQGSWKIAGG
jgi:hypothetical protein